LYKKRMRKPSPGSGLRSASVGAKPRSPGPRAPHHPLLLCEKPQTKERGVSCIRSGCVNRPQGPVLSSATVGAKPDFGCMNVGGFYAIEKLFNSSK